MAATNSTKKTLNKFFSDDPYSTLYANHVYVNTGNMAEKKAEVKNGKFVPNTFFNKTYTLGSKTGSFEETGTLLNYNDGVVAVGDDNTWIYGHPDKWVYDTSQKYNNCGVISALNILSMAGKMDIVAPTSADIQKFGAPYTVTKTDPVTGETTTEVVKPKVDFTSSEELLTLYAIQHDYCVHSKDISAYKTVKDIKYEDGVTYTAVQFSETQLYHDTIQCITSILKDYGVKSHIAGLSMTLLPVDTTIKELTDEGDSYEVVVGQDEHGEDITETRYNDKYTSYSITAKQTFTQNYSLNFTVSDNKKSTLGTSANDTLIFSDLTLQDFKNLPYVICEDGRDLIIYYSDINYVRVSNFYSDINSDNKTERSSIGNIKFSDGSTMALSSFANLFPHYSPNLMTSNRATYGPCLTTLLNYIIDGKGIVLTGYGETFRGELGGGHAITLAGAQTTYETPDSFNDVTQRSLRNYTDVTGFYVVETGGFLAETGGAQLITPDQLYRFLTNSTYYASPNSYINYNEYSTSRYYARYVLTDDCIKKWADNLNLNGNNRRNTLFGNEGNNIIKGKANSDNLYGRGGNDTLYGGTGNDYISGGAGNNVLYGGSGNDTYVFQTTDENGARQVLYTGTGSDNLRFENSSAYDDTELLAKDLNYLNSDGNLVIDYTNDRRITVKNYFKKNMYTTISRLDDTETIAKRASDNKDHSYDFVKLLQTKGINYELNQTEPNSVKGTKFKDFIVTTKYNDTINALANNDSIVSAAGNDVIKGGTGNDTIVSGYGNKKIYGEKGSNRIIYRDNFGGYDTIYSGAGNDYISLTAKTRDDLLYSKKGKSLVVTYDKETGSSITVSDYFAKKGNTSVKYIKLQNGDYLDLVREYSSINKLYTKNRVNGLVGSNGHDTLSGGSANDVITGGGGDDVLKAGKGNDTVTGGLGSDALYSQGGYDTFVYETMYDGNDTIYGAGSSQILVDMSTVSDLSLNGTLGFNDGYQKYLFGDKNYAYSKSGNDLIIDYAKSIDQEQMSTITLSDYFKSKTKYYIRTSDSLLDLKKASIYFEGKKTKTNKISGSKQADIIYGGDKADTIKGWAGSDIIAGGKGNDVITGGKGHNKIIYKSRGGVDTINLTKNEKLDIVLDGNFNESKLSYKISKKDLIINYNKAKKLVLKNFGASNVTGSKGNVKLYISDKCIKNLVTDIYLAKYKSFSAKKTSYTGKWQSEFIDASKFTKSALANKNGVKIYGKGGNDSIVGSQYNDTINGGTGKDTIIGGSGTNTINGSAGSDTYVLFNNVTKEKSSISDSGKSGTDTALLYTDTKHLQVWFNVTNKGKISKTFNIQATDKSGNKATLKGVEVIKSVDGSDSYTYNYKNDALRQEVAAWLNGAGHKYSDVNTAIAKASLNQVNELVAIFNKDEYWTSAT